MMDGLSRSLRFAALFLLAGAVIATVVAQTTPAGPPAVTQTATFSAPGAEQSVQQSLQEILEEPSAPDAYHYDPQGRRDPFRSLIGPAPKFDASHKPVGVHGFLIDELKLQGVVRTKQGFVGMVDGPDNKGYLIRIGDKVLDGEVIRITPNGVVFRQEVNDPTQIERFREVVKDLSLETQKKK
jgi:Tfp pilus assembly protein PilP